MKGLKLIFLNIERSKHLDLVIPFLQKEQADVVCLQEVDEKDMPLITKTIEAQSYAFSPMLRAAQEVERPVVGIGVFSHLPALRIDEYYYAGSRQELPEQTHDMQPTDVECPGNEAVSVLDVQIDGNIYRIASTHFAWSPQGKATDRQRTDMQALLRVVSTLGEFVLCGDFNAPRGGEIWNELANRYQDNIPPEYKTSIDVNLHRAGKDRPQELADKMVDGLFTTPHYKASGVRLVSGVSDHMAVVATISRKYGRQRESLSLVQ